MGTSLYDLSVASYLQVLGAINGFMEKGANYCKENQIDTDTIAETRIYPNMLPFRFQVYSISHHSKGAIEGVKSGVFKPPPKIPSLNYAGLQELVSDAHLALSELTPEEINAFEDKDVLFQMGEFKLPFTAPNFIMSFSFPNFYFHATTAYSILRSVGVPLGKRDFLGVPRMKG